MVLIAQPFNIKANSSQLRIKPQFEYYIFISGVDTREDVLFLEGLIKNKNGVTYFMADRFPVRCFILRADRFVSEKEFKTWIGKKYKIVSYGEGEKAKESAYLLYVKQKKSNP